MNVGRMLAVDGGLVDAFQVRHSKGSGGVCDVLDRVPPPDTAPPRKRRVLAVTVRTSMKRNMREKTCAGLLEGRARCKSFWGLRRGKQVSQGRGFAKLEGRRKLPL